MNFQPLYFGSWADAQDFTPIMEGKVTAEALLPLAVTPWWLTN